MFVTKLWQYHAYLNSTASIDENGFVSNFPMSINVYSILNGCDGETLHLIISSRDFHFNFVLICLIVGYWTIKPARWHFSFNYLLRSNCVFFTLIRINSFEIYIPPFAMESDRYVNIYYAIGGTELLACIYCDALFCIPVWWTLHFILINVINKHFFKLHIKSHVLLMLIPFHVRVFMLSIRSMGALFDLIVFYFQYFFIFPSIYNNHEIVCEQLNKSMYFMWWCPCVIKL